MICISSSHCFCLLLKISILLLFVILLVIFNLNGSSRKLMMQISDYNNDKGYSNNNIHRMINNKEYINNTKAIEKINMKPDERSKNNGIHN